MRPRTVLGATCSSFVAWLSVVLLLRGGSADDPAPHSGGEFARHPRALQQSPSASPSPQCDAAGYTAWFVDAGAAPGTYSSTTQLRPLTPDINGTCADGPDPNKGTVMWAGAKHVLGFDLGPHAVLGGVFSIDTCGATGNTSGSSFDTELFASSGSGCPSSFASLGCSSANNDACGLSGKQSNLTVVATGRVVTVVVAGYRGANGSYVAQWSYAPPSPTSSITPSSSSSGSLTPSASLSLGATPSVSPSTTPTSSLTPSRSMSISRSVTATPTDTPTLSSTPSPSNICAGNVGPFVSAYAIGGSGVFSGSTAGASSSPIGPGSCATLGGSLNVVMGVPSALISLDLGPGALGGGMLRIDTCGSSFDTVLFVGGGCPSDWTSFGCVYSNDDDTRESPYGCGGGASALNVTVPSRFVYVLVSALDPSLNGPFSLRWAYTEPTASPTPSATGTPTPSVTPTSSRSVGSEPSLTPSGSASVTATPSPSDSSTATPPGTPSASHTSTSTGSSSRSPPVTPSRSATPTLTPSGTPGCAMTGGVPFVDVVALNGSTVNGYSGWYAGNTATGGWTPPGVAGLSGSDCPSHDVGFTTRMVPSGPLAPLLIDLGAGTQLGGVLTLSTCGNSTPSFDTMLFVGAGCPAAWSAYGCFDSNDDAPGLMCGTRSLLVLSGPPRVNYVVVGGFGGATGAYNISWSYAPPSASPSTSPTVSPSVSGSPSPSLSSGASPSSALTPTPSGTGSITGTTTPSPSHTPSPSTSATTTMSATPSESSDATPGVTPSVTPSPSPSSSVSPTPTGTLACAAPANGLNFTVTPPLSGLLGWVVNDTGAVGMWTTPVSGLCTRLGGHLSVPPGPVALYLLDLGPASSSGGGVLSVDTCSSVYGAPATYDSQIFVGSGCPTSYVSYSCLYSDDNSPLPACGGGNGLQSSLTTSALTGRFAYIIVGGAAGASGVFNLSWSYVPSTPSPSPTLSPTGTSTSSASASLSLGATGTPTSAHTRSVSSSPPPSASSSLTGSRTPSYTGSSTRTSTVSVSASVPPTPSSSVTPSGSATRTSSSTPSSSSTGSSTAQATSSGSLTSTSSDTLTSTMSGTTSATGSMTPSLTRSATGSVTPSPTPPITHSSSGTTTSTPSGSPSPGCGPGSAVGFTGWMTSATLSGSLVNATNSSIFSSGNNSSSAALWSPPPSWAGSQCSSTFKIMFGGAGPHALIGIDLGVNTLLGGVLIVDTCSPSTTFDTQIYIGSGCPTSDWASFGCVAANLDGAGGAGAGCPGGESRVAFNASNRYAFVVVEGYNGASGTFALNYAYTPPSPSLTPSSSLSTSPQSTPSASLSTGASTSSVPTTTPSQSSTPTSSRSKSPPPTPSLSSTYTPTPSHSVPPSSTSSPSASAACVAASGPNALLNGISGWSGGATSGPGAVNWAQSFAPGDYDCSGTGDKATMPPGSTFLSLLDLGAGTPLGGSLALNTCGTPPSGGSAFDTVLLAGAGCASSWSAFGCAGYNDDAVGVCAPQSAMLISVVSSRFYSIIVGGYGADSGAFNLTWAYVLPSASASATGTPSTSPTPSPSASLSLGASASASGSISHSSSPTVSPTGSHSSGATPTSSGTGSRSSTPSASRSPPGTPSHTPSASGSPSASPGCAAAMNFTSYLSGTGGSISGSTGVAVIGAGGVWSPVPASLTSPSNTCADGTDGSFNKLGVPAGGPKAVFALDIGAAVALGGVLSVDTCFNTSWDSQLFIGTGCPSSFSSWGCLQANDDACGPGGKASALTLYSVSTRAYYVVLAGFGGASGPYALRWAYAPPSVTSSPTPSSTQSSSVTPTSTLSSGASPSPSPSATGSVSGSGSRTASFTPSGTSSASITRSSGGTPSITPSSSSTASITPSRTGSPSPSSACFGSSAAPFTSSFAGALSGNYTGNTQTGAWGWAVYGTCDSTAGKLAVPPGPKAAFSIDLGAGTALGGVLTLSTCVSGSTTGLLDTLLFGGQGCPTTWASFSCALVNDDYAGCGKQSTVVYSPVSRFQYALLAGYNGTSGPYVLSYSYAPPSPSASISASISATPSTTPSHSLSRGASPSGTSSSSASSSVTPSGTPSLTTSSSSTGSGSSTRTTTTTPSGSPAASTSASPPSTPSITPSASVSPYCGSGSSVGFSAWLTGPTGSYGNSTLASAGGAVWNAPSFVGSCQTTTGKLNTTTAGPRALIGIDLGANTQLGGVLLIDTCSAGTNFDTQIWVGAGCPTSFASYSCALANDNGCPGGGASSLVALTPDIFASRYAYVIIGGAGGAGGFFNLSWSYAPPSATPSSTCTPSTSPSGTPTSSHSSGLSGSRTASSTPSPSASHSVSLSVTPSGSTTGSHTPSPSASLSTSPTGSTTPSATPSSSPTPSGSPFCFSGSAPPFTALLNGSAAGTFSGNTGVSPWTGPHMPGSCTTLDAAMPLAYPSSGVQFSMFALDLGATVAASGLGGSVTVNTCAAPASPGVYLDTQIFVGTGCPSAGGFDCVFANDDTDGCGDGTQSALTAAVAPGTRYLYVAVAGYGGAIGDYVLTWAFTGTPPSPSTSRSGSVTPSNAPSPSLSFGASGSSTATHSLSASGSPPPSPSPSAATPSSSGTRSATASISPSPTSANTCGALIPGMLTLALTSSNNNNSSSGSSGGTLSGALSGSTSSTGWTPGSGAFAALAGTCPGVNGAQNNSFQPDAAGGALVLIDLGAGAPLGGSLALNTCNGTAFDSLLFVGTGCPTSTSSFACMLSSDDAPGCGPTGKASALSIAPLASRFTYAVVEVYGGAAGGAFNLSVVYTPPSPTCSGTASSSASPSTTPSSSLSHGASVSPSSSRSASGTGTPSGTPSKTGSSSVTSSRPASPSSSATITGSSSPSGSLTPSPSPTSPVTHSSTPSGTPPLACPGAAGLNAWVTGVTGTLSGNSSSTALSSGGSWTPPSGGFEGACVTGLGKLNTTTGGPRSFIGIDLGAGTALGGFLTIDTCGAGTSFDTLLWVGSGCPTSYSAFACVRANDNGPVGYCGSGSQVNVSSWSVSRFVYVLVGGAGGASGAFSLQWSYVAPTPSASLTPSMSASPPVTPTSSLSIGASPSRTATPSGTATPPITGTSTPSASVSATSTPSASASDSRTGTPSPSPFCAQALPFNAWLSGYSGAYADSTASGVWGGALAGSCPAPGGGPRVTAPTTSRHLIGLDLGAGAVLGGTISLNTCAPVNVSGVYANSTVDTVLTVGTGCPTSTASWGCIAGNDNAAAAAGCGSGVQSSLSFNATSRYLYVVVGSYFGSNGSYVLSWSYAPPSPSSSSTPSGTSSPTASPSPTLSRGASPSITPSTPPSSSSTPSSSASSSTTGSNTPSHTPTPSNSPTPSSGCLSTIGAPSAHVSGVFGSVGLFDSSAGFTAFSTPLTGGSCSDGSALGSVLLPNPGSPQALVMLDLGPGVPLGGRIALDTCSGGSGGGGGVLSDTVLFLGEGCPSNVSSWGCVIANDDDPGCVPGSGVQIASVSSRFLYAIVAGAPSAPYPVNVTLSWAYSLPSPSSSSSVSASASHSATLTATHSLGASATTTATGTLTASGTQTASGTGTRTGSGTPTRTPSPTASATATPSSSTSGSHSGTPAGTGSPTSSGTPSPSPSSFCAQALPFAAWLTGPSGAYAGGNTLTAPWASPPASFTSGAAVCPAPGGGAVGIPDGGLVLLGIDIGLAAAAAGGVISVNTCTNSTWNTMLFVGDGCPISFGGFNCLGGNDDTAGCGLGGTASSLALPITGRYVYVVVGGYAPVGGAFTLTWSATPPSPSATPTCSTSWSSTLTPTGSLSFGSTPSATASRTPSNSGTPSSTPSGSSTASLTRSSTSTGTQSPPPTASRSRSGSVSASSSGTSSRSESGTSSLTATMTSTASLTPTSSPTASLTSSMTSTSSATSSMTPTSSKSGSGTPTATFTPSSTASPSASHSGGGTGSSTFTATMTGSGSGTPSLTKSPTTSGSSSGSGTGSKTGTMSPTMTPTSTSSTSGTRSHTPSASDTATASLTPTMTASSTSTPSQTRTPTGTATKSGSGTTSPTPSTTQTPSLTMTSSGTSSGSMTGTVTSTGTASRTANSTASMTQTASGTMTPTQSGSATTSMTRTMSGTMSGTSTASRTSTSTASDTGSASSTHTPPGTASMTSSLTATMSGTGSATHSASDTRSSSGSPSSSPATSGSMTSSGTPTASVSVSRTSTGSLTPTSSPSRASLSATPSVSGTMTMTSSSTGSGSAAASSGVGGSGSASPTHSASQTESPSGSFGASVALTPSPSSSPPPPSPLTAFIYVHLHLGGLDFEVAIDVGVILSLRAALACAGNVSVGSVVITAIASGDGVSESVTVQAGDAYNAYVWGAAGVACPGAGSNGRLLRAAAEQQQQQHGGTHPSAAGAPAASSSSSSYVDRALSSVWSALGVAPPPATQQSAEAAASSAAVLAAKTWRQRRRRAQSTSGPSALVSFVIAVPLSTNASMYAALCGGSGVLGVTASDAVVGTPSMNALLASVNASTTAPLLSGLPNCALAYGAGSPLGAFCSTAAAAESSLVGTSSAAAVVSVATAPLVLVNCTGVAPPANVPISENNAAAASTAGLVGGAVGGTIGGLLLIAAIVAGGVFVTRHRRDAHKPLSGTAPRKPGQGASPLNRRASEARFGGENPMHNPLARAAAMAAPAGIRTSGVRAGSPPQRAAVRAVNLPAVLSPTSPPGGASRSAASSYASSYGGGGGDSRDSSHSQHTIGEMERDNFARSNPLLLLGGGRGGGPGGRSAVRAIMMGEGTPAKQNVKMFEPVGSRGGGGIGASRDKSAMNAPAHIVSQGDGGAAAGTAKAGGGGGFGPTPSRRGVKGGGILSSSLSLRGGDSMASTAASSRFFEPSSASAHSK